MDASITDRACQFPGMCMFTKSSEGPFVDLQRDFDVDHQGRMYMRVSYAEEIGRRVGMVAKQELDALNEEIQKRDEHIRDLEAGLAEHEEFERAARHTMARFGEDIRRSPGRPRKTAVAS